MELPFAELYKIKMVETNVQGIEIDTPEDLKKAQEAWR